MQIQATKVPHLVILPLPYQGHINPMLQLATLLHSKGFSITVIHTHFNSPNPSNFPNFNFEPIPDGLSDSQIETEDPLNLLAILNDSCQAPFQDCLSRLQSNGPHGPVTCIITDDICYFTKAVADQLKLPRILLGTSSATCIDTMASLKLLRQNGVIPITEDVLTLWDLDTNVLVAVIGDTLTKDFEERSNYYDTLLAAESRANNAKKGIHSAKDSPSHACNGPANSQKDEPSCFLASAKKAKDFLPFMQQSKRLPAVVDYVLLIPKETCSIPFSFSGVRCPGRDEPFSDEAIAFMRRKILQRDVEIEVETVDRTGTFLGSLWESKTNMAVVLLESGLARLQTAFGADRIPDSHLLAKAEQSAKNQRLKEATNGSSVAETKQKEVLKVVVTEVLDGGKFYVQTVGDQKVAVIQQQLASLTLQDPPVIGAFNPKKGDIVLAQFSADNSWNRAMVRLSLTTKSGSFYVLEKLVAITSCQFQHEKHSNSVFLHLNLLPAENERWVLITFAFHGLFRSEDSYWLLEMLFSRGFHLSIMLLTAYHVLALCFWIISCHTHEQLGANIHNAIRSALGCIMNTFDDLEPTALEKVRQDRHPMPLFAVGPLYKFSPGSSNSLLTQDYSCMAWLDKQAPQSVIYISFGSLASIAKTDLVEIAWGLANSDQPFLWVVRPGSIHGHDCNELPEGFEEKTQERGRIVKWAPQQEVLAHPSVGGFWTHNGWNSTLESICEGVPMLCSPYLWDQNLHARYVSHVWRVGIQLENGFDRSEIELAVRKLMVENGGKEMRERVGALKENAMRCMVKGGSSYESLESLVDLIMSF
ncbi:UDP-glycosyltransferase 76B1-like [Magnolia sinica]|uniref:UDP-glycosyltransferase 76B1-like n=1 Tax=Magnolia sinica TaxID=86752 RepID=UPI002659084D|nr:UDP-glycosyltransferase 76B1-like [Magnolia sinica]